MGGGAVAQHFDVVDGADRNEVDIDRRGALLRARVGTDVGGSVAALAVYQQQHVVGTEAAQRERAGEVGGVAGLRQAVDRWQQLDQRVAQIKLPGALQVPGADHIDGTETLGGRAGDVAGAGDHHILDHDGGCGVFGQYRRGGKQQGDGDG